MVRCASEDFEPEWLLRTMREAGTSMRASHDRSFFRGWDRDYHERQLTSDEIADLAEALEKRFKSWTGFSLSTFRERSVTNSSLSKDSK